jgi:hypothetical protein
LRAEQIHLLRKEKELRQRYLGLGCVSAGLYVKKYRGKDKHNLNPVV